MKKIFTILILSATINLTAQEIKQPISEKSKNKKTGNTMLVVSGASFVIGSIINFHSTTFKMPTEPDYKGYNATQILKMAQDYKARVDRYEERQLKSKRLSGFMYGLGGFTLAIGGAIKF